MMIKVSKRLPRVLVSILIWFAPVIVCILFVFLYPLPDTLNPSWSRIVRYSDGSVMRVYLSTDEKWRIFLPLEEIDPLIVTTTVLYEDKFFWHHSGVNMLSILRALYTNVMAEKVVVGGSTLTMQLARIAEPKPRNILSKIIEMVRAVQYELRIGKKGILERYLNLAPYGGNIEGIGAASLGYYSRLPGKLTPEEVAFLVSLPQSPSRRRPGRIISNNPDPGLAVPYSINISGEAGRNKVLRNNV